MTPKHLLLLLITISIFGISFQIKAQLPVDPTVIHGAAAIDIVGNHMTVTNSPDAILNWQSFSIGPDESVYFNQPDETSQVLNRVTGNNPSEIFGSLGSNGTVWLINPYGVLFGPDARIDVAGLMASTHDIANIDFLASKYQFNALNHFSEVKNQGEIRTSFGGRVWLIGNSVKNEGLVETPGGQIVHAAGESIELVDSGAPNVIVRVKSPENETVNLGALVASNGNIDLHGSIVNQAGITRANSLSADESGRIVLKASDTLMLAENALTQADNSAIQLEGNKIHLQGEVSADAIALKADEIVQQGHISASGGDISIQAESSTYLDGQIDVSNMQGAGGNITLATGKLEGTTEGVLQAGGEQGGKIQISGDDAVNISSSVNATGSQQGGQVEITGDTVMLLNADIDASGGVEGGSVHLGGGWQGSGELSHAREIMIGVGSEVKANGNENGGEVVVWSTERSEHYGNLQAQTGGRVELSSVGEIILSGEILVGSEGEVLYDPKNLIITDNPPDTLLLARKVVGGSFDGQLALEDEDSFGFSVALDGDRMAVGAIGDDTGNSDTGAVYLFTGVGTDYAGLTLARKLDAVTGAGIGMPFDRDTGAALNTGDQFGSAVALSGDHLAVGAPRSDQGRGSVYLFNSVGNDFSELAFGTRLDSDFLEGSTPSYSLDEQDFFGFSVALEGDRLVVGADRDDGSNSLDLNRDFGAVYFFSGVNATEIIPIEKLDNSNELVRMGQEDLFGRSVGLDGDRLVVGAPGGIPSNDLGNSGKVYLFSGIDSVFSNRNLQGLSLNQEFSVTEGIPNLAVGDGFGFSVALQGNHLLIGAPGDDTGGNDRGKVYFFSDTVGAFALKTEIPSLNLQEQPTAGDFFGGSLAIDGDRFAVGAYLDDTTGTDQGALYLFTGLDSFGEIAIEDVTFGFDASNTSYITPATLEAQLNQGNNITLQANNDITVLSGVNVNEGGSGGDFSLMAGRNITFNTSIDTDNGDFTAVAGDPGANDQFIDPGIATLLITEDVNINVGSGTATLAAVNGNFSNNNNDAAITTNGGRWLIYADDPITSTEGFSSFNKHYNQSFNVGSVPDYAENGNWFFYDIEPVLSVAPSSGIITYGDANPSFSVNITEGFIDGDTIDSALISGNASWSVAGTTSSSGNIIAGTHDVSYVSGLTSDLGYQFTDDTNSLNELTINTKTVNTRSFVANDKVYDGTIDAVVTGGALSGVINGDNVSLSGSGAFDTKNAGVEKTVRLTAGSLSGNDSGNYSFNRNNLDTVTAFADITPRAITVETIRAEDKVYDGDTSAEISNSPLNGVISGDSVFISNATATFDDKQAGVDKTVHVSNFLLGGDDRENYNLNSDNVVTTADITPKNLVVENINVRDKIYDGTTDAQLSNNPGAINGVIEGDDISISEGIVAFESKNVGSNKSVSITDVVLIGSDSANYSVDDTVAISTATITPKDILVESFNAENKIYDGELKATIKDGVISGVIAGDSVSLSGEGAFNDKNAGENKTVVLTEGALSGSDSENYELENIGNVTAAADINRRTLTLSDLSAIDKTYDGKVSAQVTGKLNNLIADDHVGFDITAEFENKDTGIGKTVTLKDFLLNGDDGRNYLPSSVDGLTTTGNINRAALTYRANPVTRVVGNSLTDLSGEVIGFIDGENLENATTGELVWETPVDDSSLTGRYPIYGSGLAAKNYQFNQDPSNDNALALQLNPSTLQATEDTSVQAINTAASAAMRTKPEPGIALAMNIEESGVVDVASSLAPTAESNFGRMNLAHLSWNEMGLLMNYRKDFKEKLFSDAIDKLALSPSLSDVLPCTSITLVDTGVCRITDMQRKELKAKEEEEEEEETNEILRQKNKQTFVVSTLPEIERKIVVLFGVDQYTDQTIPSLENSISDIYAIGQLFEEQLGYETRFIRNAKRADIIRTLNQLATEIEANDSVVVYYAGHGYLNEENGSGYWIPADASASDPTSWISNSSISEMLAGIDSKQMVMISDSCYSGAFTKEGKFELSEIEADPADILAKRTVVVMSSGGEEPVADEGRGGHSIFAWFLMQTLQNIDTWKIGANIFKQIQTDVSKSFPQTPQYGAAISAGHELGGDYLFEFRKLMKMQ